MLWWKVIEDFTYNGPSAIKEQELRIINRIFSNERAMSQLFTDSKHAKRIITPILEQSLLQSK